MAVWPQRALPPCAERRLSPDGLHVPLSRGLFLGQSGQGVSYSVMAGRGVLAVKPVPGRVELGCRFCRVPGEGFMVTPSE